MKNKVKHLSIILATVLLVVSPFSTSFMNTTFANDTDIEVEAWLTQADESKKLEKVDKIYFQDDSLTPSKSTTIDVNEHTTYQEMDGFGAALSGSSAYLINRLPAEERTELLSELFGNEEEDANFSFLRVTMGASDFNTKRFTYNDMPEGETDPDLEHFTIEEDADVIAVLQEIVDIQEDIKIMASPWSAPAWMKEPETLNGGRLKEEHYDTYANYFVKFIEAYQEEGIDVYAVTVQNEPHHESGDGGSEYGYPTMRMTASAQAEFVKNHLGPAFEENNIDTKIIIWDHNWNEPEYPLEVLEDDEVKEYVAGTAFHCYAGDFRNQSLINNEHPDKGIWFTECSGGDWATDFGENLAWNMENIMIGSIRNWSKSVLLWNLALDENAGPITPPENEDDDRITGGCSDCRGVVTIDSETNEITRNEEYYILGHASKFVQPGAERIESSDLGTNSIQNVAFMNPDGSKALIAMNNTNAAREFKVRWGSQSFIYELDAGSVITFTWDGEQSGSTIVSGLSRMQAENFSEASTELNIENTDDIGGGSFVGGIDTDDYIRFENVDLDSEINSVLTRVATAWDSGIEFRVGSPDGHLIGTVDISNTGGWLDWKTISAPVDVTGVDGINDLYLVFQGPVNVNWFQFSTDFFQDTLNYVNNGSFETGDMKHWSGWNPGGQDAAHNVTISEARTGSYKVDHWLGDDYMQSTYQTIKVPNGTYTYSVWVRSSGDQEELRLEAKNYGGDDIHKEIGSNGIGSWTQFSIENIHVTNGQVEIGVFSNANGGNWANFDDFSLHRVTTKAPTSATSDIEAPGGIAGDVLSASDIELSWNSVEGAVGYKIYRSLTVQDQTSEYLERTITSDTSFVDYGLTGDTTYNYVVTAYNNEGESLPSQSITLTTEEGVDSIAPAAPTNFSGEPRSGAVKLYWDNNIEFDFLKYNIYQDGERVASVSPVTETSIIIDALQGGHEYSFTISAEDIFGNESEQSDPLVLSPTVSGFVVDLPNMSFEAGDLTDWEGDGSVDDDFPHSGEYKLTHSVEDGELYTYRVEDVPNGEYAVSVWVRSGGLETLQLQVRNYGGDVLTQDMFSNSWDAWTPFTIENIEVTNGQIEFGVFSQAGESHGWAGIDDFELISYSEVEVPGDEEPPSEEEPSTPPTDNELLERIVELEALLADLTQRLNELKSENDVSDVQQRIEVLELELLELSQLYEDLGYELSELEERLSELQEELNQLKEVYDEIDSPDSEEVEKEVDAVDESSKEKEKQGEELPDTATNMYSSLLIGFILLSIGGVIFFVTKKRYRAE
ncbi:carbohydrate-binding protein [Evansella cellulosilytica]|uniref:LPXTG-motif cell wall anchor domain protein n=1 Tax=Evansella cellulosilytica (strain ATCC 21833 / DSM 2522 / FERM P-1141 / JCM 9156 / N-4) TaxID=649639 RepID=E6TQX1_EVAC2|nr:carbohydrate-binding protein [Evansella cellulosilytica]ADU31746.1 LPXTG-motif cell wall anchor domain protein [Evansella cellulosilytica DSM 2522]